MPTRLEFAGDDESVASVVSRAADNAERAGLAAVLHVDPFGGGTSGAGHQGSRRQLRLGGVFDASQFTDAIK